MWMTSSPVPRRARLRFSSLPQAALSCELQKGGGLEGVFRRKGPVPSGNSMRNARLFQGLKSLFENCKICTPAAKAALMWHDLRHE
jgi:hypothetical protein